MVLRYWTNIIMKIKDLNFEETKKLAEQGDAEAQNYLGVMYHIAEGTLKNDLEALDWFRRSMEQGNAKAFSSMAIMYSNGASVKQNYIYAYALFSIAMTLGDEFGLRTIDIIKDRLSHEELQKGQELFKKCADSNYMDIPF